jgi:hypothetical protein
MAVMPRNPNPNVGFRGNPDGVQGTKLIDYGVYAHPLHNALARYGYRSTEMMYATDAQIMASVNQGWPVVVWVTYLLQRATPQLAQFNGVPFFLVPHEHTVLVVGYNSQGVIVNDPWTTKQVSYRWANFNRAWAYFANMALAVEPCPPPLPVSGLSAKLASSGLQWTWQGSARASRYAVQVTRLGTTPQVMFAGSTRTGAYTLPAPVKSGTYEISVQAVSPCGGTADTVRLLFQVRARPTRTPVPGTVKPTATPTSTPTATPGTPAATAQVPSSVTPTPSATSQG